MARASGRDISITSDSIPVLDLVGYRVEMDVDGVFRRHQGVAGHAAPRGEVGRGTLVAGNDLELLAGIQFLQAQMKLEDQLRATGLPGIPSFAHDEPPRSACGPAGFKQPRPFPSSDHECPPRSPSFDGGSRAGFP